MTAEIAGTKETRRRTPSRFNPIGQYSWGLPGDYYYSPDIYEREREKIWFDSWQYVCATQEVAQAGDFARGRVLDQEIVVLRGRDNTLRAFYNVCKHRGHILVGEERGRRATFSCPFHGWTYDLKGDLKAAPNSKNIAEFDFEDYALTPVRCEEFGPFVFVNLNEQARPLAEMVPGLLEDLRGAVPGLDNLHLTNNYTFEIKGNWKFILDGLECYHCPYIHPHVMGSKEGYMTRTFETSLHEYWSSHIGYTNREFLEKEKDKLPYDFGELDIKDVFIWFLYPNIVFVAHQGPSNFKILQAVPTGPETCVRHMINFTRSNPPTEHDLLTIEHYKNRVWPADQAAIESQARGVKSRGFSQSRLMVDADDSWQSEAGTHHFEHLVWKALNGENY